MEYIEIFIWSCVCFTAFVYLMNFMKEKGIYILDVNVGINFGLCVYRNLAELAVLNGIEATFKAFWEMTKCC